MRGIRTTFSMRVDFVPFFSAAFTVNSEASKDVSLVKISVVDLVSVDVSVNRISGAILSASVNSSNLPRDVVSAVSVKLSDLLQKSKLEVSKNSQLCSCFYLPLMGQISISIQQDDLVMPNYRPAPTLYIDG